MRQSKAYNVILVIFLLLVCGTGLFFSTKKILIIFRGEQTIGTVTDVFISNAGRHSIEEAHVLYKDNKQNPHVITYSDDVIPAVSKGEVFTVYYNQDNPAEGEVPTVMTYVMPLLIFAFLITLIIVLNSFLKNKNNAVN